MKTLRLICLALAVCVIVLGLVALLASPDIEAAKGGKKKCCNPALEPGANGNPLCFEGHTCCSDGVWRCNNPDATPSCPAGSVCS